MDEKISKVQSPDRQMGHSGLVFAGHRTKKPRSDKDLELSSILQLAYREYQAFCWAGH